MSDVQFDSFGEPIAASRLAVPPARSGASRWALIAGNGVFWSLVVGILTARALYFDPDFASKFAHVASLSLYLRGVFGV